MNGSTVVRLRNTKGLSQQQLASAAGLSITTIWRLENDKHPPLLATLAGVAKGLGMTLPELLEEARRDVEQEPQPSEARST